MLFVKIVLELVLACCLTALPAETTTLRDRLYEIDTLRAGRETPFVEVEQRCDALLKQYTAPREQGEIYLELAHVYAQSGQVMPGRTLQFSRKALEYPLDPPDRLQLYVYWGDALQVAHRGVKGQELVAARREAVLPYLEGLRECVSYPLPPNPPELPVISRYQYDGPTDAPEYIEWQRRHQEEMEVWQRAQFQRSMIEHRDTLTGQIAFMYSRFPWASEELRQLATGILGDEAAVEQLMSRVDAAVATRRAQLGWATPLPPEPPSKDSGDSVSTVHAGSPDREIFLPKASLALRQHIPFVLDLRTGRLIDARATADSEKALETLTQLGQGDIAWDGALLATRKARVKTGNQGTPVPLSSRRSKWANTYPLPPDIVLPCRFLVENKEGVSYAFTITAIQSDGIRVKYSHLGAAEPPQHDAAAREDKPVSP